ncbi:hypothetical protein [Phenylobacterium sp.]|uniref:hypothetical protein n=1 Tax=Phenylobacterium sp. TaxID=1871053 RepID=UPI0035B2CCD2
MEPKTDRTSQHQRTHPQRPSPPQQHRQGPARTERGPPHLDMRTRPSPETD